MIVIMLGAQGTGKGTVAGILENGLKIPQISTGDIFRKNIKEKTSLGILAEEYISKGDLVPNEVTVPMVQNRISLEDANEGFILDGFPRTISQAEKLDEMLAKRNLKVDLVVNLITPREEIITRIIDRRVCVNQKCKATYNITLHPSKIQGICDKCGAELIQRKDDMNEESIKNRLEIYDKQTLPLVEYYEKKGILQMEEVSKRINRFGEDVAMSVIKSLKNK